MVCGKCLCQWQYVPSLGSISQVEYKVQQKCFVRMRSSGLDLPDEKHFGIRDTSFQVHAQWPSPCWDRSMGWMMASVSATPPSP